MAIITLPLPNIFANGTTADANQVNANLNQITANVNANAADAVVLATTAGAALIGISAATNNAGATVQAQLTNVGSATGASNVGYTPPGASPVATTTGLQLGQWLGTSGNPITIPTMPVGNALATNSVLAINSTTLSATVREMAMQVGITATTGSTRDSLGSGDKVALYTAAVGQTGGGNIWAFNPLVTISSGWTGCTGGTNQDAQVAEFDLNNNNVDYGPSSGVAYGNPAATGIIITGAGTKYCTAAIQIVGATPGSNPMWRFGIWFGLPGVQNATIVDNTNSVTSYIANGSHTYGIDFNTGTYSGAPIRLGNGQALVSRNSGGSADFPLVSTSVNAIIIGGAGASGIFCSNGLFPSTTNTTTLGQSASAWSALWTQQAIVTAAAQNNGAGTISFGSGTASTIGAAGAASALPANPVGYMIINVAGNQMKIPYYNP